MKSRLLSYSIVVFVTLIATTIYAVPETRELAGDIPSSLAAKDVNPWPVSRPTCSPGEKVFDEFGNKFGVIRAVTKKDGVPTKLWVGENVIEGDQVSLENNRLVFNSSRKTL